MAESQRNGVQRTSEDLDPAVLLDIWKHTVNVQMHFNDLELRIRNYALIVAGALLALGGYAIKEAVYVNYFGLRFSASGLIILLSIIPILSFYFMDRWWYHRLLKGAVLAGIAAEAKLGECGYSVDLGTKISEASPFIWRLWGRKLNSQDCSLLLPKRKMHSEAKMDFFYFSLVGAVALVGVILLFPGEEAKDGGTVRESEQHEVTLPASVDVIGVNELGAGWGADSLDDSASVGIEALPANSKSD